MGGNSHLRGAFTEGSQPIQLPYIMGLAHNTIWRNILWPRITRVERCRVSVFSILPAPIKVNEHSTSLGRKVENVGISQVPKDDVFCMKNMQRIVDVLQDNGRNKFFVLLELPNRRPIDMVHNDHV